MWNDNDNFRVSKIQSFNSTFPIFATLYKILPVRTEMKNFKGCRFISINIKTVVKSLQSFSIQNKIHFAFIYEFESTKMF